MTAVANTEVAKVGTGFRQPHDTVVLHVPAALNVDLAQVFAMARQVSQGIVVYVKATFADKDLL